MPTRREFGAGSLLAFAAGAACLRPIRAARAQSRYDYDSIPHPGSAPFHPPERTTDRFKQMRGAFPWLADAQLSIGWLSINDDEFVGSATLLDRGCNSNDSWTIALCRHETMHRAPMTIRFALRDGGYSEAISFDALYENASKDTAYGNFPCEAARKYGLKPVTWAESAPNFSSPLLVGFPGRDGLLDAVDGHSMINSLAYVPTDGPDDTSIDCNVTAYGDTKKGTSGGGAFDRSTGYFQGIIKGGDADVKYNATGGVSTAHTVFTPVSGVWAEYSQLFPERAAHAVLAAGAPRPSFYPPCQWDRRKILELGRR